MKQTKPSTSFLAATAMAIAAAYAAGKPSHKETSS